jgi:hypothetical protein
MLTKRKRKFESVIMECMKCGKKMMHLAKNEASKKRISKNYINEGWKVNPDIGWFCPDCKRKD